MGRMLRWGELEALGMLEDRKEHEVVDVPGLDIFGEPLSKKHNFECTCPRCHRTLAAQRFAPHLEKCMGMGRNSSRIASRRLAQGTSSSQGSQNGNGPQSSCSQGSEKAGGSQSSTTTTASATVTSQPNGEVQSEEEHFEEDEDDEDWTLDGQRKRKHGSKKIVEKISPKSRKGPLYRVKTTESRGKRGGSPMTDSPSSLHDDDDSFASLTLG